MESSQNLLIIFAFGCTARAPNFRSIEVCIPELQWFLCLCEKKKKTKNKNWNFGHSYLENGWRDLLQLRHVASCYRRAFPQQIKCSSDKRSQIYECVKIATLLSLLIYSLPFAHTPYSWAARHTTVCLDLCQVHQISFRIVMYFAK